MALTYGFYNALNHDRLYDAIQMSSIFDGIIRDGIFSTIGTSLVVTAPEDGMYVNVGPGRAWFNHTWTLNDTLLPVEAEQSEVVLDRIDAVALEVNAGAEVRANSIKFIKGTPSSNPVRPTMIHNAEVNQYALAYVRIRAGQTTIFQADVTNVVGTDETPFVTGLLQQLSIENLILQWEAEFRDHFSNWVTVNEAEYDTWTTNMQNSYTAWMNGKMAEYAAWFATMEEAGADDLAEMDTWFQHMKDQLDEDAAGHLQAEIDALSESAEKGSVVTVTTTNSSLYGRTVTISQGGESRTASFDNTGTAIFESIPYVGTVSISSTDGIQTASGTLNIPYFGRYSVAIAFWAATINITTTSSEFYGKTIKVAKNGTIISTISFNNSGNATYTADSVGTYTFTVTYDGTDFDQSVSVTAETTYYVTINAWIATLNMTATISTLYGRAITISKGGATVGTTAFDSSGRATYKVHESGTYTISSTDSGGRTYSQTVNVTAQQGYNVSLGTITRTVTLYSAANDTVIFTDATGTKTATTNSSGVASNVSITVVPGASVTFTSSVAKNPDNLSAAYTKTVTINDSTTQVNLMPSGALYWYGWKSSNLENLTTANGWSNYVNGTVAYNTQSVSLGSQAGIGNKNAVSVTKTHAICSTTILSANIGVTVRLGTVKDGNSSYTAQNVANTIQHITKSGSGSYAFANSVDGRTGTIYALWYE